MERAGVFRPLILKHISNHAQIVLKYGAILGFSLFYAPLCWIVFSNLFGFVFQKPDLSQFNFFVVYRRFVSDILKLLQKACFLHFSFNFSKNFFVKYFFVAHNFFYTEQGNSVWYVYHIGLWEWINVETAAKLKI